jgi:endo-1,4-beta-mannosidase
MSVVTFRNNVFMINNESFFPIGWYDCDTSDLAEIHQSGTNVVLPYYFFLYKEHNASPETYKNTMQNFLDKAEKNSIKVIVQLPTYKYDPNDGHITGNIMDNSYIDALVPALKNHPALLGWYHLDEPEANQVTNGLGWPLKIIEQWYHEIKKWDPYHPTFLSYGAYQVNDDKRVNEVYTF